MMDNFVYHHPVKIMFGAGNLDSVGTEVGALGNRVLLVYGQASLKENGILARVVKALSEQGLEIFELPGVQPNPLLSFVHNGISKARRHNCNVILAVGGGSVIDTAKTIAAGVSVNHDVWKFFTGKKSVHSRLPIVTVPTIAGSGSEINHGIVLTNDEKQLKFGFGHRFLIPDVCIADPSLTFSVPASETAAGGIDTICHCLEPYLSTTAKDIPLQKGFLETIGKTMVDSVPACLKNPQSYQDRSTMLWCSMAAMSGYGSVGLGKVYFSLHALEHPVSVLTGIAHGHGLAALLPGWLDFHKDRLAERLGEWGVHVFGVKAGTPIETADATIAAFRTFLQTIDCPVSLRQIGCSPKDLDDFANHAMAQARIWRLKHFTVNSTREILELCYEG